MDNSRVFRKCHIAPNTVFSTLDIYATYSMVEAGLGTSMNNQINSHLWNESVKYLPLQPNQPVEIGLAYQKKITPAAELFLNEIKGSLPKEI